MYIRNRPIERDEVVIGGPLDDVKLGEFLVLTLPADACPPNKWGEPTLNEALVEPLLEELKSEYKAWVNEQRDHAEATMRGNADKGMPVHLAGLPYALALQRIGETPEPAVLPPRAYRYCRHCGRRFCYCGPHSRIRYCSNACIKAGKTDHNKEWSQGRAAKRSNRRIDLHAKCERCGSPVSAERAGKRYCSTRCRVAAFRARKPV
jgi:hypothetical protein